MKTTRLIAQFATFLGGLLILLGLGCLLSLAQAETKNQFIVLLFIALGGVGLGYTLFIQGANYLFTGEEPAKRLNDSANEMDKLLAKSREDTEKRKKDERVRAVISKNILLQHSKERLDTHNKILGDLDKVEIKISTINESILLRDVKLYHYDRVGELQAIIQRLEKETKESEEDYSKAQLFKDIKEDMRNKIMKKIFKD